jgi:citrate synthase
MVPSQRPSAGPINIDSINVDSSIPWCHDLGMTTWVRADEAARLLGVTKPTLYAYVSRGLIERHTAADGRTSLYARRDLDALTARARTRATDARPTIDVQVTSAITALHDDGLLYRGRAVDELARTATFEQVAELLWTGELPAAPPAWPVDRAACERVRAALTASGVGDPVLRLALAATTLAGESPLPDDPALAEADAAGAARRLLALTPNVLSDRTTPDTASRDLAGRLTRVWVRRPSDALVAAVGRALVLLADHELATSTLAVRVATSVRTDPYSSFAVGLHTVRGVFHGSAAPYAAALFDDAARRGAAAAVAAALEPTADGRRRRLAGFGHVIYREGDPRVAPLLEAVARLGSERFAVVEAVRAEGMRALGRHPNVDFALGAMLFVAGLPRDAPIFAVARIAGWAAHDAEERGERPVRYRGLARQPA